MSPWWNYENTLNTSFNSYIQYFNTVLMNHMIDISEFVKSDLWLRMIPENIAIQWFLTTWARCDIFDFLVTVTLTVVVTQKQSEVNRWLKLWLNSWFWFLAVNSLIIKLHCKTYHREEWSGREHILIGRSFDQLKQNQAVGHFKGRNYDSLIT